MGSNADAATLRFSTDMLPEWDRLALFREVFARTLVGVDMEPSADRPLYARVTLCQLPQLATMTCAMSAGLFRRPPSLVADGNDDYGLIINTVGFVSVTQRGRNAELQPGEAILIDCSDPSSTRQSDINGGAVFVPRASLRPLMQNLDDVLMRPVRRDSEALRMLVDYLDVLHGQCALSDGRLREHAAEHVRQLLALALGATRDAAEQAAWGGVRAARLIAIKRDVAQRLGSFDELDINAVASRHGVGPRYVQMLFQDEGTTYSAYLRDRRLEYARFMLRDSGFDHRSIGDIALLAGFGDLSHFNRAFRQRYHATPSEIRAAALVAR